MKHALQLPNSTVSFFEDDNKVILEVTHDKDGYFYNDEMNAKQLHDLIGVLLHLQSKVRTNGNR